MTNTISISYEFLNEIIVHCKGTYPSEACGILVGGENTIGKVYKIRNISNNSQVTYEMSPQEQLICEKEIKEAGLKIIGIYHSHPSSEAYPSQTDVMRAFWPGDPDMPAYPEAFYMIVGPVDGDTKVRAFKIDAGHTIKEIKLNVI